MSKMKKKKAAPSKRAAEQPRLKRAPAPSELKSHNEQERDKLHNAVIENDADEGDDAPELPGIPQPLERKSWMLKTMSDFSKLPRDQFPYAIYYAKFELNKALVIGYAIDHFIWHEGGKLETIKTEASALD